MLRQYRGCRTAIIETKRTGTVLEKPAEEHESCVRVIEVKLAVS